MIVYLNGEFLPQEEAKISPMDRGFLFGDGIYEAIPFYKGKPFSLEGHWNRLQDGLAFMKIEFQETQESMDEIFETLFEKNNLKDKLRSTIYLQITRGAPASRAHVFPVSNGKKILPTVFITCQESPFPSPERWNEGFSAALIPDQRWGRVDVKTVNLLANVMAAQEAKEYGADEAILKTSQGFITEGAKTNVFAVLQGGTIVTHPLSQQILPGITRNMVVEEAQKDGLTVEERPIAVDEIYAADEVFITSTTSEIKPIVQIDDKIIGTGSAGEMSKKLVALLRLRIEKETGVVVEC